MSLLRDAQFGARALLRRPGFAAAVVLTLALGIGATTAIFSIVNAALLRPLPYHAPERLVLLWERSEHHTEIGRENVVSPFNFQKWRAESKSFSEMGAIFAASRTLTGQGEPQWLRVGMVSEGFFRTMGVEPVVGRFFLPEEDRPSAPFVVVLGNGLWRSHFGGDPGVVGKRIVLNGVERTVVGVLPPGFQFLEPMDLWTPVGLDPAQGPMGRFLTAVGRLEDGVSAEQAQAEMDAIAKGLTEQEPDFNTGWGVRLMPLREHLVGDSRATLLMLLGAVIFVLLIACANVANLFLSRATARQREVAIRAALGADRARLIRQMLTESSLIAFAGGALGLAIAWAGTRLLGRLAPDDLSFLGTVGLDWRVLLFAVGVVLVVALLTGLAPAIALMRPDLRENLQEGSGKTTEGEGRLRLRGLLVVTDVAMAVILLIGAGLMLRSLQMLQRVDLGYDTENLLTLKIGLPQVRYPEGSQKNDFYEQALEKIRALPGVKSATAVSVLPLGGLGSGHFIELPELPPPPPGQEIGAAFRFVAPGYFETLGIPLLQGRDFTAQDRRDSPFVAVIGKHAAESLWPGKNAIGRPIETEWVETMKGESVFFRVKATVVGVVGDIREKGFESQPETMVYWALRQMPTNPIAIAVRGEGDPKPLTASIRNAVLSLDPDQPIHDVATMEELLSGSISQRRFSMALLTLFSALALILAAIGIYGVLSYAVAQRTREIGIRMALGSARSAILRLIVGQGMRLALLGLAVGLPLAYALAKVIASLFYQVSLADPLVYAAAPLLLLGIIFLACWLPARRAADVDPIVAIRSE